MFLALRDIRFAKGRFALMTVVVALVTLLLVVLSTLTRGLGQQSTSAVESLPSGHFLLAPSGGTTSWPDSVVRPEQVERAQRAVPSAEPLAVARARATSSGSALSGATTSIAVFGADPGSRTMAQLGVAPGADEVVLPSEAAEALAVGVGDGIELNGKPLRVVQLQPTRWYSHSPVAWTSRATANAIQHLPAGQATAVLVGSDDAGAAAHASGLTELDRSKALSALPGYSSERGSLLMIQAFLYGISALVVLAFLSVWTIQRTRDIAVLRALGGSRRYVLGDSLGQAAILLAIGTLTGGVLGTALALAVQGAVPVQVATATTLAPPLGVALVGLLGSLLAIRRVSTVSPLLALGGN